MATKWGRLGVGRHFFFFSLEILVYGVLVRFSTRGVQKHHKYFLWEVHVKNFWPKQLRKNNFFPVVFPIDFFYRVFGRFSVSMRSPKAL
jgi:hypothetical protein